MTTKAASTDIGALLGEFNLRDYVAIAKRRKFWIIFPALAVTIIVTTITLRLPNIYRCDTVILIDPQKVPDTFVRSTVTTNIVDRLSTIYEEVTSPARLKRLVDTMGLYPDLKKQVGEQEVIRTMQRSINVEPVTSLGAQISAFRITFKGRNPVETSQVANQLAAMFIEENLKTREQESYGTADFLDSELQKTSQQLQEKEKDLAEIRSRFIQDLPESEQFHVQEAESLRLQLRTATEHINQAEQQKIYLQSIMATTAPTVDLDLASNSPYQSQIEDLETKLSTLQNRYGPSHPDVRKLQAQLDDLKAKNAKAAASVMPLPKAAKSSSHNPVVDAQLEKLDEEIQNDKKAAASLQEQINFHLSKLEQVPVFQQKTAGTMRDYDALRARYTQLLDKKLSADTASAMESRQKSERFVILDPAQVPDKPYSPNRVLFILGGLLGGIAVGAGLAAALEVADDSVRSDREAEHILAKPVLAGVPEILTPKQVWVHKIRVGMAAVCTAVLSTGAGLAIAHYSARIF